MSKSLAVALIQVGPLQESVLNTLVSRLPAIFPGATFKVVGPRLDVKDSYNSSRRQHHSTRILVALESCAAEIEADRVLGVTELDLYVPNMNFVFGEARLNGGVGVISTHRLRTADDDPGNELFTRRVVKEAVHEIGHTLGFTHCHNPFCVMFFSNTLADTDRKQETFCPDCNRKLVTTIHG